MKFIVRTLFIAAVFSASQLQALRLGLAGGISYSTTSEDIGGGASLLIGVKRSLDLVVGGAYYPTGSQSTSGSGSSVSVSTSFYTIDGNVRFNFNQGSVKPYAFIGAQYLRAQATVEVGSVSASSSADSTNLNLGAGLVFGNLFYIELKSNVLGNSKLTYLGAGLQIYF